MTIALSSSNDVPRMTQFPTMMMADGIPRSPINSPSRTKNNKKSFSNAYYLSVTAPPPVLIRPRSPTRPRGSSGSVGVGAAQTKSSYSNRPRSSSSSSMDNTAPDGDKRETVLSGADIPSTIPGWGRSTSSLMDSVIADEEGDDDDYNDGSDTSEEEGDWDERDDHMMPGLLSGGVSYLVKKVLVQGWVHKKGTGSDWIGSRAWKPRWAVLALVSVTDHEAHIPVLQIYWNKTSPSPSTVIHLDSAVVLPEQVGDSENWNSYRFKIQHLKKTGAAKTPTIQATRSFSCPKDGRDSWVYAMNQALLEYEKEKATARGKITSQCMPLSPKRLRLAGQESFPQSNSNTTSSSSSSSSEVEYDSQYEHTFAPLVIKSPKSSRPSVSPPSQFETDIGPPLLGEAFL